jgi:hypothetical protein
MAALEHHCYSDSWGASSDVRDPQPLASIYSVQKRSDLMEPPAVEAMEQTICETKSLRKGKWGRSEVCGQQMRFGLLRLSVKLFLCNKLGYCKYTPLVYIFASGRSNRAIPS